MLAAGFAVAVGYAIVALVEALASADAAVALPFAYTAVSIAGPLGAVAWLLREPRGRGDEPGDERPEPPGPPDPGGDPPPPWWPEFERQFWSHVERDVARARSSGRP